MRCVRTCGADHRGLCPGCVLSEVRTSLCVLGVSSVRCVRVCVSWVCPQWGAYESVCVLGVSSVRCVRVCVCPGCVLSELRGRIHHSVLDRIRIYTATQHASVVSPINKLDL